MTIETRKVYISEDGREFDTLEKCQSYENRNGIGAIERKIAELTQQRNLEISLKNRYKANKYGNLPMTEYALQREYGYITKMSKIPIEKMSDKNVQFLMNSFKNVEKLRLQKKQQKMFLDDLREKINERGTQIKILYEKVVKMKVEKLNS